MPKKFSVQVFSELKSAPVAFLKKNIPAANKCLKNKLQQMNIVCVGDRRMRQLHRQFMNLDSTTDVLTFPMEFDAANNVIAGEIYVCIPQAIRQARQRGIAVSHEALLYAIHGMLHLCGFDDRTKTDFETMHKMEDQILTRLGLGKIFSASRSGGKA